MHARYMLQRSLVYALTGGPPRRYRRSKPSPTPLPAIPRLTPLAPAPRKLSEYGQALQRQFTVYVPPDRLRTYRPPDPPTGCQSATRNDIAANHVAPIRPPAVLQQCTAVVAVENARPSSVLRCASVVRKWAKAILTAGRDRAER